MAQVTQTIGSFSVTSGTVRAEIDWNDANGQITRGRVINDSLDGARMEAHLNPPVNGWSIVGIDAPGKASAGAVAVVTAQNLPNNTVKMTEVTEDGVTEWKLIGVRLHLRNV